MYQEAPSEAHVGEAGGVEGSAQDRWQRFRDVGGVSDLQEHLELLDFGVSEDWQLLYAVQRDGSILFFW